MKEKLLEMRKAFYKALEEVLTPAELDELRIYYLGKSGALKEILKQMGGLRKEDRPVMGELANELRDSMGEAMASKLKEFESMLLEKKIEEEKIDITLPGEKISMGRVHPTTKTIRELIDVFVRMGL